MSDCATVCTRCKGTGFVSSPRAHLNVPGLCFHCDGDGTRATQLKGKADRRQALRLERLRAAKVSPIQEKIYAIRRSHLLGNDLAHTRWAVLKEMRTFTTQEYADKFGLSKQEAWIELCCNRRVYVKWSEECDPLGWTIE